MVEQGIHRESGQTVIERLRVVTARWPDAIALEEDGRRLSYAELDRQSNRIAQAILEILGSGPEPVALLFSQGIEMVIAILGVVKAGKAYLPLDEDFTIPQLQEVFKSITPRMLISHKAQMPIASELERRISPALHLLDVGTIDQDIPDSDPDEGIEPDTIAVMLFTSGSTGKPKIVQRSHRTLLNNMDTLPDAFRVPHGERVALTMHYTMGWSRATIFQALMFGATLIPFDMRHEGLPALADWLRETKSARIQLVSSVLRQWVQIASKPFDIPDLRYVLTGGDILTRADVEGFRKVFPASCALVLSLGLSEIGLVTSYVLTHDVPLEDDRVPVGYAASNREIWLLDEDHQRVPPGEVGEIVIRSEAVTLGYVGNEQVSRTRYIPDPDDPDKTLFYTGDLGRMDSDGCLTWLGRKDSEVKIRGMKVVLDEVELRLRALPGIADAVVATLDAPGGQQQIVGYMEHEPSMEVLSDSAIREHLATSLSEVMVPAYFVWLPRLPRLPSGKVDRQSLPSLSGLRPSLANPYVPVQNETEQSLVAIWEDLLDIAPVGIDDKFFDLGGHSLLASAVVVEIKQRLGHKISMARLSQAPTIRLLADILQDPQENRAIDSLVAIRPDGSRRPLFCVHPRGGLVGLYHHLARHLDLDQPVYGLQAVGLDGLNEPHRTIEEMAAHYIDQIKQVQAQGPYNLAGFSMGGAIAHEMACQLEAAGEDVGLLALLDAYTGHTLIGYLRDALINTSQLVGNYTGALGRTLRGLPRQPISRWATYLMGRGGRVMTTQAQVRADRLAAADPFNQPEWTPERRVLWANRVATENHQRKVYHGQGVFFLAEEKRRWRRHPQQSWSPYVTGGLEVIAVPGTHRSMIEGPELPHLAERFKQVLAHYS